MKLWGSKPDMNFDIDDPVEFRIWDNCILPGKVKSVYKNGSTIIVTASIRGLGEVDFANYKKETDLFSIGNYTLALSRLYHRKE